MHVGSQSGPFGIDVWYAGASTPEATFTPSREMATLTLFGVVVKCSPEMACCAAGSADPESPSATSAEVQLPAGLVALVNGSVVEHVIVAPSAVMSIW